ncbi:MAG: MBL fold metallo-hydrolase [Rhodobacteraceae bacterium]|nr:MBL fold metallo-hydrolase [Paracoccaceae bacterium]
MGTNWGSATLRAAIFFLAIFALSLGSYDLALAAPPRTPPGIAPTSVEPIGKDLYSYRWGPYRTMFAVTGEGVIVADPLSDEAARALDSEIDKLTAAPVKYVVYSHSHWDHAAGARVFKDQGATIVAQDLCAKNISETPHPDVLPPDVTFADDFQIKLGDQEWDLHYFGPSHSDCLIVIQPKPANILYLVDVLNPPFGYSMPWNALLPDDHIYNFVPFFDAVDALAKRDGVTQITGGHLSVIRGPDGKPAAAPALGPASAIADKRRFWDELLTAVGDEWAKGTYSEVIPDQLDLDRFADTHGYNRDEMWLLVRRLGSYYAGGR